VDICTGVGDNVRWWGCRRVAGLVDMEKNKGGEKMMMTLHLDTERGLEYNLEYIAGCIGKMLKEYELNIENMYKLCVFANHVSANVEENLDNVVKGSGEKVR